MKFKLKGKNFEEVDPEIKFSNLNAMAFVSKVQSEQPAKIEVAFDGNLESMLFLNEIAGEIGYFANIEGTVAQFEKV